MKIRLCLLFCIFLSCSGIALAQNARLAFPHFAVGDQNVSVIDLTNKGTATFVGDMAFADDTGYYVAVNVNGAAVTSNYAVTVPAGAVRRYQVTASGATKSGHVVIWDRKGSTKGQYDDQISGTLVFQFMSGQRVLDATAVSYSGFMEHFFFIAEYTNDASTGLAVSDPFGDGASLQIKAISGDGQFVDGRSLPLAKYGHRALFVHELLSIPNGFRGTIEVESDTPIPAVVLKLQKDQFSSVEVAPFKADYDVSIALSNGAGYQAEMTLSIASGANKGLFHFVNVTPDSPYEEMPITGIAAKGLFMNHTYTSIGGRVTIVTFVSTAVRTNVRYDFWLSNLDGRLLYGNRIILWPKAKVGTKLL